MANRPIPIGRSVSLSAGLALVVCLASLLWAYWTTLGESADRWLHDPQYSHGFLVPAFALVLLWFRRDRLQAERIGSTWWGLLILGAGIFLRLGGAYFHFNWLDAISLLPCIAGLAVMIGGWEIWRWSWPAILFLAFMIPLPYRVGEALADPLRHMATVASTFVLQTVGIEALSEGNRVLLNDAELDIVGACSGLRMLVIFFALSTAVALVVEKPRWEKGLIVASAVPIAIVANLTRIVSLGIVQGTAGLASVNSGLRSLAQTLLMPFGENAQLQVSQWHDPFHDVSGWFMMPLGLVLMWIELTYLNHLLLVPQPKGFPLAKDRSAAVGRVAAPAPRPGAQPWKRVRNPEMNPAGETR